MIRGDAIGGIVWPDDDHGPREQVGTHRVGVDVGPTDVTVVVLRAEMDSWRLVEIRRSFRAMLQANPWLHWPAGPGRTRPAPYSGNKPWRTEKRWRRG